MKNLQIISMLLSVSFGLKVVSLSLAEDPGPRNPYAVLGIHGAVPEAKALHEKLDEHDQSIRKLITKIYASSSSIKERDFCQLYVQVEQYRRWQRWLSECKEACARDFQFRERVYSQKLQEVAGKFWASQTARVAQQKVLQKLTRANSSRLKQLEKILKTLENGDAQRAEEQYYQLHDTLFAEAAVLTASQKKTLNEQLSQVQSPVDSAMVEVRRDAAQQALVKDKEKFVAYASGLLSKLKTATADSSDSADSRSALLESVIAEWTNAHRGLVRIATLHTDVTAAQKYSDSFFTAVEQFVSAEADRVKSEDEAKRQYTKYRDLLSDLAARQTEPEFVQAMQSALQPLAEKAGIARRIANYSAATRDLLRWRARTAAARAQTAMSALQTPSELAQETLTESVNAVPVYRSQSEMPMLTKAIPEVVPTVEHAIVGEPVRLRDVFRLDTEADIRMSRIEKAFYCKLSSDTLVAKNAIESLKESLLVSEDQEPPTIEAVLAIHSAEAGCYENVGGTIRDFRTETFQSRLATLPSAASGLVGWNRIQSLAAGDGSASVGSEPVLLFRLDVEPAWAQHRYFFIGDAKFGQSAATNDSENTSTADSAQDEN